MMGTTMMSAGTGSRNVPSRKKNRISTSMASDGLLVMDNISCSATFPTPARLMTQLNKPAPASVTSAAAVIEAADAKLA